MSVPFCVPDIRYFCTFALLIVRKAASMSGAFGGQALDHERDLRYVSRH